ncbi:hypothetical protein M407DRAFT_235964 [Tulasnella calospora MUT 4182]|uniref:Uncharacterized protein n=1 Tax=Tulasnella calospora MUT 4182 TaxID=1051891 RepID=A0A0C3QW79_9AGAM|nr:hypothetical protein M407DRAFT_235964 [Tulasnella calospora MUT 4182]
MHPEAGPSNVARATSRQVDGSDDPEDAKKRTIKITMGGGLWNTANMLETLIPEPDLRDMATAFPDGRDGETNIFFVSFPSTEIVQVVTECSPNDLTISPVTDSEFEIFATIYRSAIQAAATDYVVPRSSGCSSPAATAPSPLATSLRSPHFKLGKAPEDADEAEGSREGTDDESAGQVPGPPRKRRRLSDAESTVTLPTAPLTEDLWDMLDRFTSALLREFASAPLPPDTDNAGENGASAAGNDHELGSGDNEGCSTPRLSAKAKGKRPMK